MNLNIFFTVIVVCLVAAFHHGYHMGITNVVNRDMMNWVNNTRFYKENDDTLFWSIAVSMFPIGAALGVLFTNGKSGYQTTLFCSGLLTVTSQLLLNLCREAKSVPLLIIGRFLIGISAGLSAGAAPIYLAEIATEPSRGRVVTLYQVFLTLSMWLSHIWSLGKTGSDNKWVSVFISGTIFPLLGTILIKFCPESPKYVLMVENDERKSLINLRWMRATTKVSQEFREIIKGRDRLLYKREVTVRNICRFPVLVCFMVVVSEQLCGIGILICNSTEIFLNVGFLEIPAHSSTLIMGFSMVFGVFCYLILVEIVGRRILYLVSMGSLFFITILLTVSLYFAINDVVHRNTMKYVVFGSVQLFSLMYGIGVGPSKWLIIVEPFNFNARPLVASLVLFCNFTVNGILVMTFILIKETQRFYMFIAFTVCDLGFFIFAFFFLTGKSAVEQPDDDDDD